MATALAVAMATTISPASAAAGGAPAATRLARPAGVSVCLGLWAAYNAILLRHLGDGCSPAGTYHIHVWGGGRDMNYPTYTYNRSNLREFSYTWPVPAGTNICAELWYHKPGGGYESWGLPCETM
ncbi:hypothetical protein AB0L65_20265 [Nonomuraea sp. NPDC052116]|uniref:hypothetical protein n=1 Tax=Nonomuraea sp. NPDC052116 TaxID=3155665 RepID=UPI003448BDEF